MSSRVVITGFGTLGPHGVGKEPLAKALREGGTAWQEVDRSRGLHLENSARLAGFVSDDGLRPWLSRQARRMSRPSRFAVAAARMAFEDAGIRRAELDGRDVAVVFGTAFGPGDHASRLMDQINKDGPESISPMLFMESVANVHAGQVALDSGLRGPNATITQREVSPLLAVDQAARYIRDGRCEMALAGATDEIAQITHVAFDRLRALARDEGEGELARPFDRDRNGLMLAEGACVVVLEDEQRARERGAPILARIEATARAHDPTATGSSWGDGHERLARTLRRRLHQQGVNLESVDRVVSGAAGSRPGDRLEAMLLRELFPPNDLPVVLAPKGCTGESGGGYLGAAMLAMTDARFGSTVGFRHVDPALEITPHDGRELPAARQVLVTGLAVGGGAAWLLLSRV